MEDAAPIARRGPAARPQHPAVAARQPGEVVLGRYELVRVLGRGGAGTVWQAEDRHLGRPVAIKCLPGEGSDRALAEARAAARLSHPTVVSTYGLGTAEGCVWLVTEFVAGDTLRRTIAEDTHTDDELLQIGVALCVALRHAHARGIVHRDVTPRNVLVPVGAFGGPEGPVRCDPHLPPAKLADFGIARLADDRPAERPASHPEGAPANRIVGTLSYMAPERLRGEIGDAAGDLWALGVILHEAFVGEHPAGGPDKASALVRTHAELPSLRPRRPDLPAGVVAAIDRACAAEPDERGTVAELEAALRDGLAERAVPVAPVLREAARPRAAAGPRRDRAHRPSARRPSGPVHVHRVARRPGRALPLLPLAPLVAAAGAAVGPAAGLALLVALVVVGLGAAGRRANAPRSASCARAAAGVVVLALVAAAAGLVVPAAVTAAGGPADGPLPAVVALVLAIAAGGALGRNRTSRSIR
nr:serine/threonine-protein kinase [Patulibacter sp. SYSU D01012]